MKRYQVKVIEKHSDIVWVEAESPEDAMGAAVSEAECTYESLYDCEVLASEEDG